MDESNASAAAVCLLPVGKTGGRSSRGPQNTEPHGGIGYVIDIPRPAQQPGQVQRFSEGPGTDRYVDQGWMQRVAQPCAMKEVGEALAGCTPSQEGVSQCRLHRIC